MKRIVVVGSGGQDGRILLERLRDEGHAVIGVERTRLTLLGEGWPALPTAVDVRVTEEVRQLVAAARPDEAYYLAAYHQSSEDVDADHSDLFRRSQEVNVQGLVNVLDAVRTFAPGCRTFYAASSHVFGNPGLPTQNETTPLEPRCLYGITKTAGIHACRFFRERYGLHVSAGILYNHESPYRGPKFVSQRIVRGAVDALAAREAGRVHKLALGKLSATVDWGHAPDYVDAMVRMTRADVADDFVVATGIPHTVQEFAEIAFGSLGLNWADHVEERPDIVRKPAAILIGDASKLRLALGWKPTVTFSEMVHLLVRGARAARR